MWKHLQQKQQHINLNYQKNWKQQYTYTLWHEKENEGVKSSLHHELFVIIKLENTLKQKKWLKEQNICWSRGKFWLQIILMSNMEKHLTWCHNKQVSLYSESKYIQQIYSKSVIQFLYGIFIFMARMWLELIVARFCLLGRPEFLSSITKQTNKYKFQNVLPE